MKLFFLLGFMAVGLVSAGSARGKICTATIVCRPLGDDEAIDQPIGIQSSIEEGEEVIEQSEVGNTFHESTAQDQDNYEYDDDFVSEFSGNEQAEPTPYEQISQGDELDALESLYNEQVNNAQFVDDQSYDEPSYDDQSYSELTYNEPSYDRPSHKGSSHSELSYDMPYHKGPSYSEPPYDRPYHKGPSYSEPSYDRPSSGNVHFHVPEITISFKEPRVARVQSEIEAVNVKEHVGEDNGIDDVFEQLIHTSVDEHGEQGIDEDTFEHNYQLPSRSRPISATPSHSSPISTKPLYPKPIGSIAVSPGPFHPKPTQPIPAVPKPIDHMTISSGPFHPRPTQPEPVFPTPLSSRPTYSSSSTPRKAIGKYPSSTIAQSFGTVSQGGIQSQRGHLGSATTLVSGRPVKKDSPSINQESDCMDCECLCFNCDSRH